MIGGISISILIVYLYIQNQSLNTDYLTGASNRISLENYLDNRIRNICIYGTFSLIMLDIDNFKSINDTFGHNIGDKALEDSVNLIRSTLRAKDFIARYGGDEFYIVLDGVDNYKALYSVVKKLEAAVEKFNSNAKLYELHFSMGYSVYDSNLGMGMEEFLKHVDFLMYKDKKSKY